MCVVTRSYVTWLILVWGRYRCWSCATWLDVWYTIWLIPTWHGTLLYNTSLCDMTHLKYDISRFLVVDQVLDVGWCKGITDKGIRCVSCLILMWHDAFFCVTWLTPTWNRWFLRRNGLIFMWYDAFSARKSPHKEAGVWHDSFIRVNTILCDMTRQIPIWRDACLPMPLSHFTYEWN